MHMQNLVKFHQFVPKLLSGNNPNLDLVKVKAYAKFDQTPSIHSQDIEWKLNFVNNQEL